MPLVMSAGASSNTEAIRLAGSMSDRGGDCCAEFAALKAGPKVVSSRGERRSAGSEDVCAG
jgi:hypothetical protein